MSKKTTVAMVFNSFEHNVSYLNSKKSLRCFHNLQKEKKGKENKIK